VAAAPTSYRRAHSRSRIFSSKKTLLLACGLLFSLDRCLWRVGRVLRVVQVDVCLLCCRLVSRRCHTISTIQPLLPAPRRTGLGVLHHPAPSLSPSTKVEPSVSNGSVTLSWFLRPVSAHVSLTCPLKPAPLCSVCITRPHRSYGCLRLPTASALFLASYTCPRVRFSSAPTAGSPWLPRSLHVKLDTA